MFKTYASALAHFFTPINGGLESDSGLVRMFRVEYPREYANARRQGAKIDEKFVSMYLTEKLY